MIRRQATLTERQLAFLSTLELLTTEVVGSNDPRVLAALVTASAALVVGANLQPGLAMSFAPEPDEEETRTDEVTD